MGQPHRSFEVVASQQFVKIRLAFLAVGVAVHLFFLFHVIFFFVEFLALSPLIFLISETELFFFSISEAFFVEIIAVVLAVEDDLAVVQGLDVLIEGLQAVVFGLLD